MLQQIYKFDPKQKRQDLIENFKLHLKDFNQKLKLVVLEKDRRKKIEGKTDINIHFYV